MTTEDWLQMVFTSEIVEAERINYKYLDKYISLYNQEKGMCDVYNYNLNTYESYKNHTYISPGMYFNHESDIPNEIKEKHKEVEAANEIYQDYNKKYLRKLEYNISQLSDYAFPENTLSINVWQHKTRDIIDDYKFSQKLYLNLNFFHPEYGRCGLIIIPNIFEYRNYETRTIIFSTLKYDDKFWRDKNNEMGQYITQIISKYKKSGFSPDPPEPKNPVPLDTVYKVYAQSTWESYGRVKNFLIIGVMV